MFSFSFFPNLNYYHLLYGSLRSSHTGLCAGPASESLHLLFLLSGMFLPLIPICLSPSPPSHLLSKVTSAEQSPLTTLSVTAFALPSAVLYPLTLLYFPS